MPDSSGKAVLFVCEKYFLSFYRPLAAHLRRSGFRVVWIVVDGFEQWDHHYMDPGQVIEELLEGPETPRREGADAPWDFERNVFLRPNVFRSSYPYTLNVVRTPERAPLLAGAWYRVTLALLARVRPCATFVWNGRYLPYSAVSAACASVGQLLLTSEIGWIPGTIFMDRGSLTASTVDLRGRTIDSASAADASRADAFLEDYTARKATMVSQSVLAPAEVRKRLLGPDGAFLLLYGCQVDWDTNVIVGSRRFHTNEAAVSFLLECLSAVPGARLVIKTHPLDSEKKEDVLRELVGNRGTVVSDIHPHTLIEAADCVSVRNSTLGFEALCYRRPLILLEPAKYEHPRLTLAARNVAEGKEALLSVSTGQCRVPDRVTLQKFILHLIDHYLVPGGYRYLFKPETLDILSHFSHNQAHEALVQLLRDAPLPVRVPTDERARRAVEGCTIHRPESFLSRQRRRISERLR